MGTSVHLDQPHACLVLHIPILQMCSDFFNSPLMGIKVFFFFNRIFIGFLKIVLNNAVTNILVHTSWYMWVCFFIGHVCKSRISRQKIEVLQFKLSPFLLVYYFIHKNGFIF